MNKIYMRRERERECQLVREWEMDRSGRGPVVVGQPKKKQRRIDSKWAPKYPARLLLIWLLFVLISFSFPRHEEFSFFLKAKKIPPGWIFPGSYRTKKPRQRTRLYKESEAIWKHQIQTRLLHWKNLLSTQTNTWRLRIGYMPAVVDEVAHCGNKWKRRKFVCNDKENGLKHLFSSGN